MSDTVDSVNLHFVPSILYKGKFVEGAICYNSLLCTLPMSEQCTFRSMAL